MGIWKIDSLQHFELIKSICKIFQIKIIFELNTKDDLFDRMNLNHVKMLISSNAENYCVIHYFDEKTGKLTELNRF